MTTEIRFPDRHELGGFLARLIAADLRAAVAERGRASLVVSGGTTPSPLFAALREHELPWENVAITLADERWVSPEHTASNEALVRRELLAGTAARACFVPLKNLAPTPEQGTAETERALATTARPFDVVILGMGEDGHTASLFPGAAELAAGLDLENPASCLAVHPPDLSLPRLSLTLRALLDSRRIVLHFTGESKWQVYQRAQEEGSLEELPIRGVLRHGGWRVVVGWAE